MEKVKALKAYSFVNPNGNQLTMHYGRVLDEDNGLKKSYDAQRWRFIGMQIPFPVRSGTWFVGFDKRTMVDYLKKANYVCVGETNLLSGTVHVYPNNVATETKVSTKSSEEIINSLYFRTAIHMLVENGCHVKALCLYKAITGCLISEARDAVDKIYSEMKASN